MIKENRGCKQMTKETQICSYCSLQFKCKRNLEDHIASKHEHSKRKFECSTCHKTFAKQYSLTEHIRYNHTFEKPYACSLCDATFIGSSKRLRHFRFVHTKEKRFFCSECNFGCVEKSNVRRHYQSQHTQEGQLRQKRKEENLAKFLTKIGIEFQREHQVSFSCFQSNFARIDFLIQLKNTKGEAFIVLLENDEDAHSSRPVSCEVKRMMDVYTAFSLEGNTLPIVWVRYNCDRYSVDGIVQKKKKQERLSYLEAFLQNLKTVDLPSFSIYYLFYDCITKQDKLQLELFSHEDYHEEVKPFVQVFV
jgi:Zinc finger, C2H2 type